MNKRGGKRAGSGRKKGTVALKLSDYFTEEQREEFALSLMERAKESDRIAVFVGEHFFGKAPQALDVTSGGEPLQIVFDSAFNKHD